MNFLKLLFILNLMIIHFAGNSQNDTFFKGVVLDRFTLDEIPFAEINIIGHKSTVTNYEGEFAFKTLKEGTYDVEVKMIGFETDTLKNINICKQKPLFLKILLPIKCYNQNTRKNPSLCSNKKNIIPVFYGFPTKKIMRKSNKGKIKLGGCSGNRGCKPRWYCKENDTYF